jgi:hypothetical protein
MADGALWTSLITAVGAGTSALGAVVLTNRGTIRRDRQQQEQRESDRHWERFAEVEAERRAVWSRLLKTAGRVKASSQLLSGGFQPDLRDRLRALHYDAMAVAEEASQMTFLYADDAHGEQIAAAAQGLATATAHLVVQLENAIQWERTADGETPSGGEMTGDVIVTDFDARIAELHRALLPLVANGATAPESGPADGTRPAPRDQRARIRSSRRNASSR